MHAALLPVTYDSQVWSLFWGQRRLPGRLAIVQCWPGSMHCRCTSGEGRQGLHAAAAVGIGGQMVATRYKQTFWFHHLLQVHEDVVRILIAGAEMHVKTQAAAHVAAAAGRAPPSGHFPLDRLIEYLQACIRNSKHSRK